VEGFKLSDLLFNNSCTEQRSESSLGLLLCIVWSDTWRDFILALSLGMAVLAWLWTRV